MDGTYGKVFWPVTLQEEVNFERIVPRHGVRGGGEILCRQEIMVRPFLGDKGLNQYQRFTFSDSLLTFFTHRNMDVDRSGSLRMFPTKTNYSESNDAAADHRAMVNC
jgi:hypothetical protein